jgi:DNA gyrase/topoisomerase IV subunit B
MALTTTLKKYADNDPTITKQIEKAKIEIAGEDFREGLTAVIFVKMPADNIQFESQTKTKLNNQEIQGYAMQLTKEGLDTFFEENPKLMLGIKRISIGPISLSNFGQLKYQIRKFKSLFGYLFVTKETLG